MTALLHTEELFFYTPWKFMAQVNFLQWDNAGILNANISALFLIALLLLAIVFAAIGIYKRKQS